MASSSSSLFARCFPFVFRFLLAFPGASAFLLGALLFRLGVVALGCTAGAGGWSFLGGATTKCLV